MKFFLFIDFVIMIMMIGVTDMLICVRIKVFVEFLFVVCIIFSLILVMIFLVLEVILGVILMIGLL